MIGLSDSKWNLYFTLDARQHTAEYKRMENFNMGQLMNDIVSTADAFTSNFSDKGPFDYSIESLVLVDNLLEELSDYEWDEDNLYSLESMVGCYVFETARRNYGGEYRWAEKEQQPLLIAGLPDFFVSIRAWEKVKGRVMNGKEDNIPFYIAGYKEHIERGKNKKGYSVTIA